MATGICRYSGCFLPQGHLVGTEVLVVYYDKPRSSIVASLSRLL